MLISFRIGNKINRLERPKNSTVDFYAPDDIAPRFDLPDTTRNFNTQGRSLLGMLGIMTPVNDHTILKEHWGLEGAEQYFEPGDVVELSVEPSSKTKEYVAGFANHLAKNHDYIIQGSGKHLPKELIEKLREMDPSNENIDHTGGPNDIAPRFGLPSSTNEARFDDLENN